MILTLPDLYPYVLLLSIAILFHCYLIGFLVAQPMRRKVFNKQWLTSVFMETHLTQIKGAKDVPDQGYPDMGEGFYARSLSYKNWFELNLAIRVHQNYLEQLTVVCVFILVAGLKHPRYTLIAGGAYLVGRILHQVGYSRSV